MTESEEGYQLARDGLVHEVATQAQFWLDRAKTAEKAARTIALILVVTFAAWAWYFYLHFEQRSALRTICPVVREVVPAASTEGSWNDALRICKNY
jgi:hypothetical protein